MGKENKWASCFVISKIMIKVENTRMHKAMIQAVMDIRNGTEKFIPIADAELVLVECKPEEALLFKYRNTSTLHLLPRKGMLIKGLVDYLKTILISRTEKIEEGDWYCEIFMDNKAIKLATAPKEPQWVKKVLALSEHFSPKHLQAIVDGKLKEGKVLVECEIVVENSHYNANYKQPWIKLNSSNHITLHKIEEKMYTREELQEYLYELGFWCGNVTKDSVKEWFETNIK